ncbi:unnamed protein product [Penicillium nalgiovense]|nr:unnamed protein product [Penicillium nalgiovense]
MNLFVTTYSSSSWTLSAMQNTAGDTVVGRRRRIHSCQISSVAMAFPCSSMCLEILSYAPNAAGLAAMLIELGCCHP